MILLWLIPPAAIIYLIELTLSPRIYKTYNVYILYFYWLGNRKEIILPI